MNMNFFEKKSYCPNTFEQYCISLYVPLNRAVDFFYTFISGQPIWDFHDLFLNYSTQFLKCGAQVHDFCCKVEIFWPQ